MQLSELGAIVTIVDYDLNNLNTTYGLLNGDHHLMIECNLANIETIEDVVRLAVAKNGPINGAVHCVGMRCRRPLKLLTKEVLQDVFTVNVISFFEFLRQLTRKGFFNAGLSVVAISSMSSKTGGAGISAYSSSKAALDGAIRSLASELAPKSVRINSVLPGQIRTPAYEKLLALNGGEDKILQRQYLGLGEASDVVNMILFLLSERSRLITGASIPIDGGYMTS